MDIKLKEEKPDSKSELYIISKLTHDPNSVLYLKDDSDVNKKNIRLQLKKSRYNLDKELYSLIGTRPLRISKYCGTKVLAKPELLTRINTTQLHVNAPFELFQADLADIRAYKPRGGESKYILLIVDVYSQHVYLYGIYNKSKAVEGFKEFIKDIRQFRKKDSEIKLQTDEGGEFFNKNVKSLLSENNIELFTTKMNAGHPFLAEQKIREVKKKFTQLKRREPSTRFTEFIHDIQTSMNNSTIKYMDLTPLEMEVNMKTKGEQIVKDMYINKHRTMQRERQSKYLRKKDKYTKQILKPLVVGDFVYIAYGRIKKKHYQGVLNKSTTDLKPNFYKDKTYIVIKRKKYAPNYYYYYLKDANTNEIVKSRFYRDELFLL